MFEVTSIADVAEVFNGKTPPKKEHQESGHPVLKIKDVSASGVFGGEFSTRVSAEFVRAYFKKCLKENDILILNAAHNASHVASKLYLSEGPVSGALPTGEWTIIRSDESRILPGYLYYFLRSTEGAARLRFVAKGIHLYPRDVAAIELRVPPLDEQRRIVDTLNRAASIRRLREQAQAKAREIIPALFLDMFGAALNGHNRHAIKSLREVCEIGSGVTKGRKLNGDATVEVPYLRVANVQDGFLNLGEVKTIGVRPREQSRYEVREGDLLMTEGGDPDKLGRAAIWRGQIQPCLHQNHLFRVRPHADALTPEYLAALIGSSYGKAYFLKVAKRTTGIASINKTQLGGFPVIVPPLGLQQSFSVYINEFAGLNAISDKLTAGIEGLGKALLHEAFGRVGESVEALAD